MNSFKLEGDESLIIETIVKYVQINSNVKLTLTNKKIIVEKEKGLFKKKFKVIEKILYDDIKVYKNKVQLKQNKSMVIIQTYKKNISLVCKNIFEARKLMEEIKTIKTGANWFERSKDKLNKVSQIVNAVDFPKNSKKIMVVVSSIIGIVKLFKGKK